MTQLKAEQVAWVPPETKAALLGDQQAQPENIYVGEYRIVVTDDENTSFGELVCWVDDAPDDQRDPTGHFELFDGNLAEYRPTMSLES